MLTQVIALICDNADKTPDGRRTLINPKKARSRRRGRSLTPSPGPPQDELSCSAAQRPNEVLIREQP
jgi:hypothetical protein